MSPVNVPVHLNQKLIFKNYITIFITNHFCCITKTNKRNAAPTTKLNTALVASTSKLGRLLAVAFPGISINYAFDFWLWHHSHKTLLFPKSGRFQKKQQTKKAFPFNLPFTSACPGNFLLYLPLRFKCVVHHTSPKAILAVFFDSDKSLTGSSVLCRGRAVDLLPLCLQFRQVWLSIGQIRGLPRFGRAIVSLYKHVRDVLAKVDLTVSCNGLELHQLQVLRG